MRLAGSSFLLCCALLLGVAAPAATQGVPERAALERRYVEALAAGDEVAQLREELRAAGRAEARRGLPPRSRLTADLNAAQLRLRRAIGEREGGSSRPRAINPAELLAAYDGLRAADLAFRDRFKVVRSRLAATGIGGDILSRLDEAEHSYAEASAALLASLAEPMAELRRAGREKRQPSAAAQARLEQVLPQIAAALEEGMAQAPVRILGANGLPYRPLQLAARTPVTTPTVQPSYLSPLDAAAGPADLAGTVDAPLSEEILAKARELEFDPVRIFESVRNGIATEWYAGAMKGAVETLRQGSGNDVDQASLLIALFRASSLPARYVHGIIELPVEALAASLGVPAAQVPSTLARAGVAHRPVIRGGRVAAVEVEHTWVAVQVPYTNYRGAVVDVSGKTWLPLMPAIKAISETAPTGVLRQMGFDVNGAIATYLGAPQAEEPLTRIRRQVLEYLHLESPDATYEQQLGTRSIRAETLGILPSSLPVRVIAVTGESPVLSPSLQHRIRWIARSGARETDPVMLDVALPLAELAGRRITLSYLPATVDDQRTINAFGGLDAVPVYLVRLRVQIRVDGRVRAVSTGSIPMGALHRVETHLTGPYGSERVEETVLAGVYQAFALGAQRAARRAGEGELPNDTEQLAARFLSQEALGYIERWDAAERELGGLLAVSVVRPLPSIAIVTDEVVVESAFGLPVDLRWQGASVDASLRVAEPFARASDSPAIAAPRDFLRLSALQGSALEHRIFEDDFLVEGMSADKGLGIARRSGTEVVTVTAQNADSVVPTLAHPQEVRDDIRNWARLGFQIEVPRAAVTLNAWRGAVWRVEDPKSGAAGYFIAGGLAGGATTEAPGTWVLQFLQDALAGPYSPEPWNDPLAGVEVVKLPGSDQQTGEVGKKLPQQLAVVVRGGDGRPVKGVPVTFTVWSGGGSLIGEAGARSSQLTVLSNALGIAAVTLETGQHTSDDPIFFQRNPEDEHLTRALRNVVEVVADSHEGPLAPETPFEAVAYPGEPDRLRRTDHFETVPTQDGHQVILGWPELWADSPQIRAEDTYGNPVSNVEVTFEVGERLSGCRPVTFLDAVVFDRCPTAYPRLGDCGSPFVSVKTSFQGASAGVILGNVVATRHAVHIRAQGLAPLTFFYLTRSFIEGLCPTIPGVVHVTVAVPVDETGRNINAARAGRPLTEPIQISLFYNHPPEWTAEESSRAHWVPTTGDILLSVDNGGGSSPVNYKGQGLHESLIFTGPTPALNRVILQATDVQTIKFEDGRFVPSTTDLSPREITSVWGVLPKIVAATPDPIVLTDGGVATQPIELDYSIRPADYSAGFVSLDLLEDGSRIDQLFGTSRSGAGSAQILRGTRFDKSKTYTAELVLNVGSAVEIKSDPFELPFFQRLIRYVRGGSISLDVDLVNQRICERNSLFEYSLNQDADVTLQIRQITGQTPEGELLYGPPTTLINRQLRAKGDHSLPLTQAELLPGDWEFELTAVSRDDGHTETEKGFLTYEFTSRDSLPVGHVLVDGVDLFDGNLTVSRDDFALPGRGIPLEFRRVYSSNAGNEPGPLGVGWDHNYNSRVVITPCGEVIVLGGEGSGMRFVDDGAGGLRPLKGYHGTLIANAADHSFDFYSKSGNRFHYGTLVNGVWHLSWMADPNGNRTTLEYATDSKGNPRVAAVRDAAGRTLRFHYQQAIFRFWGGEVLTRIEAPGGIVETFEYDAFGNLARAVREPRAVSGPPSLSERYEYALPPAHRLEDRHVLLATHDEVRGATARYAIDFGVIGLQGNIQVPRTFVSEVTRPAGGKVRFDFDPALINPTATELTVRVTDPRDKTTTYTLNRYGSAIAIENPEGDVTTMAWTPNDVLVTSRTDANQVTTTYTYDAHGNVLTESVPVTDFDGENHTYTVENTYWPPETFDPPYIKDRLKTREDRNGALTELTYDQRGNLLSQAIEVRDIDGDTSDLTIAHTYLANGDRATSTDARGNTTSFSYDVYGNLETVTDALRNFTETEFDVRSRPVRQVDALGRETLLAYDTLDRPVRKVLPQATGESAAPEETIAYDDTARTVTATDAAGRVTVSAFDRENRPVRVENAAGGIKVFEYDLAGNKTLESTFSDASTPRQDTTYDYSDAGRLIRRTEPLSRVTEYDYDGEGNLVRETLRDASSGSTFAPRITEHAYDGLNRRIRTSRLFEDGEATVRVKYDGENKILEEDPLGRVTRHRYDALNRLIETLEPEWKPGEAKTTQVLYDGNGNVVEQRRLNEPADQIHRMEYDAINRLTKTVDGVNSARSFEYDKVGNKTREVDPRFNTTAYSYDARNRLVRTTAFLNRVTVPDRQVVTEYAYDAVGNRTEERWPNGNVVRHVYDNLSRRIETTDGLGAVASYAYDARGNRIRETDARGNDTLNSYDALDRLVRQDLPEDRRVEATWDVAGNKLSDQDARGKTTTYSYDRLNRQLRITDPAPGNTTVTATYDLAGNKLTETDRRGNTTTYEYDALNRLVRMIDPPAVGISMSYTYDALGNRLTETDRRGIVSENAYDVESRLTRVARAGIELRRIEYDGAGNKIAETDANGHTTGYEYDERNLLLAENRPLAALTRYTLDDMGDRLTSRDPEGRVSSATYDLRRRMLSETNAAQEITRSEYDGNGNRTKLTRPRGKSWIFAYDAANRLTGVTDPLTNATTYQYDGNGNRTAQTDANQHTTAFEYDERNRMTARIEPGSARWELGYDGNGNATSLKDPNGQLTTVQYDALNRETARLYPPPADAGRDHLQSIATIYDGNGNPTTTTEQYSGPTGTRITQKTYDSFDRLETVTDPKGEKLSYTYDANGNRKTLTDPDRLTTLYTYDDLNRLASVTVPAAGVTEYSYFRDSRLKLVKYPNGGQADHSYDAAGRLQRLVNKQNTATVSSFEYGFDANGNRIQQIEVNGGAPETTTYAYDDADRLTEVTYPDKKVTYTYDGVGNRQTEVAHAVADGAVLSSKSFTYDDRDRLVSLVDATNPAAGTTFGYDANGNQTARTQGGVATELFYDVRDKLVEVRRDGTMLEAYAYDYQGLRIRKAGPEGLFRYVYDDDSVLVQTDDAGNTVSKYDYGPDRLLSLTHATEGRQFYLSDGLGSVTNLVKPDGSLAARYQYDAWGNYRATAGSSFNFFGFTGHQRDAATGLYYFKARFYDPELGLFLTEDPAVGDATNPPSLHRYLYAYANPTVYVDPDGRTNALKQAEEKLRELSAEGMSSIDQNSTTEDVVKVGITSGLLEAGADVTAGFNWLVNTIAVTVMPDGKVGQEAQAEFTQKKREVAEAVEEGVQQIVEDPGGTVTAVAQAPGRVFQAGVQRVLEAAAGDRKAQAEIVAAVTRLGVESIPLARGAGLADDAVRLSDDVAFNRGPFGSPVSTSRQAAREARLKLLRQVRAATKSTDPAVRLEGQVARHFRNRLVSFQREVWVGGRRLGEVDVELDNVIIEVAGGRGRKKFGQVQDRLKNPASNPDTKQVVVFGPELRTGLVREFQRHGIPVARSFSELERLVGNP